MSPALPKIDELHAALFLDHGRRHGVLPIRGPNSVHPIHTTVQGFSQNRFPRLIFDLWLGSHLSSEAFRIHAYGVILVALKTYVL